MIYFTRIFTKSQYSGTQGSASGTGFPGYCSPGLGSQGPGPGLILKSETGTGTQIQILRDLGLEPGLKFEKSGTEDRDSDSRDEGFRDSTLGDCPGD